MAVPALRLIKRSLPGLQMDIVVKPWVAELFSADRDIDRVIEYSPRNGWKRAAVVLTLSMRLRGRRYDTALLFQKAVEAALIAWLSGMPRRIG